MKSSGKQSREPDICNIQVNEKRSLFIGQTPNLNAA